MTSGKQALTLGRLTLAIDAIKASIKELRGDSDADTIEAGINSASSHLDEALTALR